jgi:DNA (cytosine-5)-methyltransferase 1
MPAYYNEIDPYAAQWLRNLIAAGHIPAGDVDERSIVDVSPIDLIGYSQCHFFAGIGGWGLAVRLALWGDGRPLWTGSCPCQPFSQAARGRISRTTDERHLWPAWFRLIARCRPAVVVGEQVAQARDWLDQVCDDMASVDYAVWAGVLPACAVGADHIRQRVYFRGHANGDRQPGLPFDAEVARLPRAGREPGGMGPTDGLPDRLAALRAFGNAIVPQVAAEVLRAI